MCTNPLIIVYDKGVASYPGPYIRARCALYKGGTVEVYGECF